MIASGFRHLVRVAACVAAAGFMFANLAAAQTSSTSAVNQFLANPTQVMAQYPNGGPELISLIRDVAVAHPEALATLTSLLSAGNAAQQGAVGSGLGQAYNIVLSTNQAYAAQIAAAVGGSNSDIAKTAYAGSTGNVATASTGPGAGGAGGGGGGGGSGGPAGGSGASGPPSGGSNSGSSGTTGQGSTQTSGNTFTGGGGSRSGSSGSSGSVSAR
jgi:hypothetical protein